MTIKEKYISIIIPANNEERYINKTLINLIKQDYAFFEIIVVLNGCSDETESVIKKLINNYKGDKNLNQLIKIHSCNVANVSLARNIGAEKAKGDLLLFLDADTILKDDCLKIINSKFKTNHSFATLKVKPDQKNLSFKFLMALKNLMHSSGFYHGSSGVQICRRKDFENIYGFNESIVVKENKDLIRRLGKYGDYICINNFCITSMRRFEKWGLLKAAFFWIKQWVLEFSGKLQKTNYEKIR